MVSAGAALGRSVSRRLVLLALALSSLALSSLSLVAPATAPAAAPAASTGRSLVVLGGLFGRGSAVLRGLLLEQGLTVGDRDLVVVGMNFGKGQEAVPVATVIHEGRL